jgi:hypothetical protein
MTDEIEPHPRQTAGLRFGGPKYFLTHVGLFGLETVLIQKHARPERNAVLPGALLWDDENSSQYFLFSTELAAIGASEESSDSGNDLALEGISDSESAVFSRSGILFRSPDFFLPQESLDLFGQETILIKKHVWPERNAVLPGALLWDDENKRQYFVPSNELVSLDQILGRIEKVRN